MPANPLDRYLPEPLRRQIEDAYYARINRQAQLEKVPYMLIVGDREQESCAVSVRKRSGEQQNGLPLEAFKEIIAAAIKNKAKDV